MIMNILSSPKYVILILFSLICFYILNNSRKNIKNKLEHSLILNKNYTKEVSNLSESINSSIIFNNTKIPKDFYVINSEGEKYTIDKLGLTRSSFFLRIPKLACDICVSNELEILKNYSKDTQNDLTILISYEPRLFRLKYSVRNESNNIFILPEQFNNVFDNRNHLFYFQIINDRVTNLFYPFRTKPEFTNSYIKMIIR